MDSRSNGQKKANEDKKVWERDLDDETSTYKINHFRNPEGAIQIADVYHSKDGTDGETHQYDFDTRNWSVDDAMYVKNNAERYQNIECVGFFGKKKLGKNGMNYRTFSNMMDARVIGMVERYIPLKNHKKMKKAFYNCYYNLSWKVFKRSKNGYIPYNHAEHIALKYLPRYAAKSSDLPAEKF